MRGMADSFIRDPHGARRRLMGEGVGRQGGGTGDAPTIQAAIDSCAPGDTVLAAPGTYTGAGNRDIDFGGKAIIVTSLSGPEVTIVDCGGSESEYHRGFYFHSGEDTTSVLRGFTIGTGTRAKAEERSAARVVPEDAR